MRPRRLRSSMKRVVIIDRWGSTILGGRRGSRRISGAADGLAVLSSH